MYDNEGALVLSTKQKRIRLAICCSLFLAFAFVICVIIVILVLFIPRAPTLNIAPGNVQVDSFNIQYCPSADGNDCCADINTCQFEVLNATNSLSFHQVFYVRVQNPNLLYLKVNNIRVTVTLGGGEVASGTIPDQRVKQRTTQDLRVPVDWGTAVLSETWRSFMCKLSDSTNAGKSVEVGVKLSAQVKYFAVPLRTSFSTETKIMDLKTLCEKMPNGCDITPSYRPTICT